MKVSPIIFLAGALSVSTGVIAQEEIPEFVKADADGNKFVDEKEFAVTRAAGVKQSFAKIDENKDGKLSKDEYSILLEEECE